MTHEITGTATWRATVTSPTTGEAVDQDAWDVPNQDLADRDSYLYSLVAGGGSGVGVQRIRTVADSAALKALTGITADDVAMIRDKGLFTASTTNLSIQEPFAYTSTGTAGIYWYWVGQFALDDQLGSAIVVTDPATERLLEPNVVPNRIVEVQTYAQDGVATITDVDAAGGFGSYADTAVTKVTSTLQIGDIVSIDMACTIDQNSVTGGKLRLIRQEGAGSKVEIAGTECTIAGTAKDVIHRTAVWTMLSNATLTVTVQGMATAGDYLLQAGAVLRLTVIRP